MNGSAGDAAASSGVPARQGLVLGAALIFFKFPGKEGEEELLEQYHAEDTAPPAIAAVPAAAPA